MVTTRSFKDPSIQKRIVIRLCVAIFIFSLLLIFFTQYLAYKFGYNEALGAPLYNNLYNPFKGLSWYFNFYGYYPDTFYAAFQLTGFLFGLMVLISFIVAIRLRRRLRVISDLHGSAEWASFKEIKGMGIIQEDDNDSGIIIGGYQTKRYKYYLQSNNPDHAIMIAPPRSGKGVGVVTPCVSIDVASTENYFGALRRRTWDILSR